MVADPSPKGIGKGDGLVVPVIAGCCLGCLGVLVAKQKERAHGLILGHGEDRSDEYWLPGDVAPDLPHKVSVTRLDKSESNLRELGGSALFDQVPEVGRDGDEEVVVIGL